MDGSAEGLRRFLYGLAKKVLIANSMAVVADYVFALPGGSLTAFSAWMGALCYLLQIYFDFSGYSDMAIGLGRMFGFTFKENFNYPYAALGTRFWRRWLFPSTWFRDTCTFPGRQPSGKSADFSQPNAGFCGHRLWHGAM